MTVRRRTLAGALLGMTALLALLVYSASAQVSGSSVEGTYDYQAAGPALVGSAAALPADPWTGQWLFSGDGATSTLAQSGSAITGTSPCPGTTMFPAGVTQTGTVSGDGTTASFTYSGAPSCPGAGGTYQATMQPDARVIDVRGTTQFGTPFSTTFTYQGGGTEPRETPSAARDTTAPAIAISSPASGTGFVQGQAVAAEFSCADEAGGTGVASCVGSLADGAALDTSTPGEKTLTVTATDGAGNSRTESVRYTVVAPPVAGESVVVRVLAGRVLIRYPRGRRPAAAGRAAQKDFVPLKGAANVPVGATVDTRRGLLALVAAAGFGPQTFSSRFFAGIFQIKQRRARRARTNVVLKGGNFRRTCGSRAAGRSTRAPLQSSRRTVRRLWSNARGRFRTVGRSSAATVRGTIWLTQDRCDGTLTRVRRGRVVVRDFRARRTVTLTAGEQYLARARRAAVRRPG